MEDATRLVQSYRQGLNEIMAPFLLLEPTNDFKVLLKFHGFFQHFCAPFFTEGFTQMESVLRCFDSLILYHFPDLHQWLPKGPRLHELNPLQSHSLSFHPESLLCQQGNPFQLEPSVSTPRARPSTSRAS